MTIESRLTALETITGAITEAQNDKVDLADGKTQSNVDYVVESKYPTTDDPTWYRVYKSGWVEQGGRLTKTVGANVAQVVELLKTMSNTYYTSLGIPSLGGGDTTAHIDIVNTSTTQISIFCHWTTTGQILNWEVKGMGA